MWGLRALFSHFFKTWTAVCNNLRLMIRKLKVHDDGTKWKRFPRYWPYVRGIHRSVVNSPHKGQWHGALNFYLICSWINGWVNNGEAGGLRCHGAHYNVTVMIYHEIFVIHPDHNEHCAVWKLFGQNSIRTVSHHHTKFQRVWPVIRYFFCISAREAMCMWHLTLCICTSKLFLDIGHLTIIPKQNCSWSTMPQWRNIKVQRITLTSGNRIPLELYPNTCCASQWRHKECDSFLDHWRLDCLLNRLFKRRSKKTSKLRVAGLCAGKSPVTNHKIMSQFTFNIMPADPIEAEPLGH